MNTNHQTTSQQDSAVTGDKQPDSPSKNQATPERDPMRVPPGLRKFAKATAAPANRVLRPDFKRNW